MCSSVTWPSNIVSGSKWLWNTRGGFTLWKTRCSRWPCILSTPHPCFPSSRWVDLGGRERAGCCFCVWEGRKGSWKVKLSLVHKAEHMEEGCLLLTQSEGWVDCWLNASGRGEWPVAASFGTDGAGSRRAYATTSIFIEVGWCWVFLYYCKFVKNVICLLGAQGENGGLSLVGWGCSYVAVFFGLGQGGGSQLFGQKPAKALANACHCPRTAGGWANALALDVKMTPACNPQWRESDLQGALHWGVWLGDGM